MLHASGVKQDESIVERVVEGKKSQRSFNSYHTGRISHGSNVSGLSRKSKRTNTLDMVVIGGGEERVSKTAGSSRKPVPKNNTK